MAIERTLSIIKPDATERNITGLIVARLEGAGLRVVAQKRVWWKKKQAEEFYEMHKKRDFFDELVQFMISGPIVVQVLEGEATASSWARPTRSMPTPARSARTSLSTCSATPCTAPTARRAPSAKSIFSSRKARLSGKAAHASPLIRSDSTEPRHA